jgi:hypothetical protein
MATIAPHPRLKDVENAANFITLTAANFEVIAVELAKREPTYPYGSPTTVTGPPTAGARVLNEFWRDALGGEFRCTAAGTPGTWTQIRPAAVTADPTTGMIPVGYLILNMASAQLKQHQGSYVWNVAAASAHVHPASDISDSTTAGRSLLQRGLKGFSQLTPEPGSSRRGGLVVRRVAYAEAVTDRVWRSDPSSDEPG